MLIARLQSSCCSMLWLSAIQGAATVSSVSIEHYNMHSVSYIKLRHSVTLAVTCLKQKQNSISCRQVY